MTNTHGFTTTPTRYIYGTTRLGDNSITFDDRVAMARKAIEAGLWLHTSDQYGEALSVIKAAQATTATPIKGTIFKIGHESVNDIRRQIETQLEASGLTAMTVGQLCLGGPLAEDFRTEGRQIDALLALQSEGLVQDYVLELWPWNSEVGLGGLRNGNASRLLKGFIFYLNPLQRFLSNPLWDEMLARKQPFIAMRTVAGGNVYRARDTAGAVRPYMQPRAVEIAPIFEESGCASWTEFAVRYALGFPECVATVGSTANAERFQLFLDTVRDAAPLDEAIRAKILKLQRNWADEFDAHALPWTM